jgi:hypothetical protein
MARIVSKPPAEAHRHLLRNLAFAVLTGVLCLILWANGMLLPLNLTTVAVPGSWVRYGVETSQWSFFGEDGSKLFVKRGMAWRGLDYKAIQERTIWSDCIDLTTFPIRSCGRVRACCMGQAVDWGIADSESIKEDSKKVEAMARVAGIAD